MTRKGKGNFTSKRLLLADALQTYIKQSFFKKKNNYECTNVHRLFWEHYAVFVIKMTLVHYNTG